MRELGKEEEEVIEEDAEQTGLGEELDIKLEEDKLEMRELVREEDSEYIDEEMGEDKQMDDEDSSQRQSSVVSTLTKVKLIFENQYIGL